ncbi:M16 family metallopeptidase [Pseudomonas donghuensis]|uniref:M16 family metallopeptidase n=1 Tax=Pseudomonas donghuensis TaxID=1163398 RepID=UPI0020C29DC0|nr:pitrilysin family protein [Pseudomonas donghuensis]MCP6696808.1 insulinase family protein [Pseudomonas donghuensis]
MDRRTSLRSSLLGLFLLSGQALAEPSIRHEFTLDNGLHVVISEDRRAPVVTTHMLVKVGSSHEYPGQSGLSHALEHLLYRGSAKTAPGQLSQIIERLGGEDNAYTIRDFTVHHQTLPSDRLAVALELNADLLKGAVLSEHEFVREIEAVKAERRENVDDDPLQRLFEQLQAIAYPQSSYHTPVIGWMSDLQRMHNDELRAWYRTWYAPNNATLIIVGDVQRDDVKRQVEKYFAGFPRQDLPISKNPLQVTAPGQRQVTVQDDFSTPTLIMAFNVPTYATAESADDVHALRLLSALLGSGLSARLSTRLERQQTLLSHPEVNYGPVARGDNLFEIQASINTAHPRPLAELQAAIWAELQALKKRPPEPVELARARALLLAENTFARDSLEGQASDIAAMLGSGLPASQLDNDATDLQRITCEQIQQVAKTYFTRERLAVAYLQAKEADDE